MRGALFAAALSLTLGCGQEVRVLQRDGFVIDQLPLPIANVWVLDTQAGGTLLIDAGGKGDGDRILDGLEAAEIPRSALDLVVLTHGHLDHAGAAAQLQKELDAPVGAHHADRELVKNGNSPVPEAQNLEGALLRPFLDPTFPAFTPDVEFGADERLDAYGIAGTIVHLPGHTPGSVAVLLDSGDVFIGDLARGSDEGSHGEHEGKCNTHFFSNDFEADRAHMEELLSRGARTFFPGHGPMFEADTVRGWLEDTQTQSDAREHKSKDLALQ